MSKTFREAHEGLLDASTLQLRCQLVHPGLSGGKHKDIAVVNELGQTRLQPRPFRTCFQHLCNLHQTSAVEVSCCLLG